MGAYKESRGTANGGKRGKEAQARRRKLRLADPRVASALAEAREQNAAVDAAVAPAEPAVGRPRPVWVRPAPEPASAPLSAVPDVPVERRPRRPRPPVPVSVSWGIRDVLLMLRQGYAPEHVARRTGYSLEIINDLTEPEEDDVCSWSKNGPWIVEVDGKAYGPYTDRQAPTKATELAEKHPDAVVTFRPLEKADA